MGSEDGNEGKRLVEALKELISTSEKVWEGMMRGVVLKCGEEVAVKIIKGNREERGNFAEYTALQYLALHAPSIPAPKPLGLIKMAHVRVMSMTYFPGITLEKAWPFLSPENKSATQNQREEIFIELRKLRMKPGMGKGMGGVGGDGVRDWHMDDHDSRQVTSLREFEDF